MKLVLRMKRQQQINAPLQFLPNIIPDPYQHVPIKSVTLFPNILNGPADGILQNLPKYRTSALCPQNRNLSVFDIFIHGSCVPYRWDKEMHQDDKGEIC